MKLTDEFPEPARAWFLRNTPILQQERERIYALSANFLHQTDTLDGWLRLVDEMGKSALRVSILHEDLSQLHQPSSPLEIGTIEVISQNLRKLALIEKDIQDHEYKRLYTLDYRTLVQTP